VASEFEGRSSNKVRRGRQKDLLRRGVPQIEVNKLRRPPRAFRSKWDST
jgi:hypothetical protein